MEFPTPISRTIPFPVLEVSGVFFHSNFDRIFCKTSSGHPDQTRRSVPSDLGLHYLPAYVTQKGRYAYMG